MASEFNYPARIGALSDEQKLEFYELFAHNLTVSVRAVWSTSHISAEEKVDRLKWINEILHSVTSKIRVTRLKTHEWDESEFFQGILHWIRQNPAIMDDVGFAITSSYGATTRQAAESRKT